MPKAVLNSGVIRLLEPLQDNRRDGQELRVEKLEPTESRIDEIDRDFAELAALCEQGNG